MLLLIRIAVPIVQRPGGWVAWGHLRVGVAWLRFTIHKGFRRSLSSTSVR
jgi:hypothetical protein